VSPVTDAQTALTLGSIHQRAVTTTTETDIARIIKVEAIIVIMAFDHPAPVASSLDYPAPVALSLDHPAPVASSFDARTPD
jgi:hypothetical protein